jgi:hypothetical protein
MARSINMTPNSTPHADARASAVPCKGPSARAGGRGRSAAEAGCGCGVQGIEMNKPIFTETMQIGIVVRNL